MNDLDSYSFRLREWALRPLGMALAVLAFALATPTQGQEGEFRLTLNNDFLTTNPIDDDLYTAGVRLEYSFGRYGLAFEENSFTDSKSDLRFDESYLSLGRRFHPVGGWHPQLKAGVLRVGRGLLGQSVQNAVHDLIGDEMVELTYIDETHLFVTAAFELQREFRVGPSLAIVSRGAVESSLGFKSSARLSAEAMWRPSLPVWFGVEVGGRYTRTDFSALEPWIVETGALWGVTIGLPSDLVLSWSYNQFGTKLQHFSVGYRWNPGGGQAARRRRE